MADDLHPINLPPVALDIDVLDEEESPVHPLVTGLPLRPARYLPRPDQRFQTLEIGIRCNRLLRINALACHRDCSFTLCLSLFFLPRPEERTPFGKPIISPQN